MHPGRMKASEFKIWRKSLDLTQKEAARKLGLKHRVIQYYEKGMRDGEPFRIPVSVELACYALSVGVESYDGPESKKDKNLEQKKRD